MNFQQHFLPASVAALAHVALLLSGGIPVKNEGIVRPPERPEKTCVREIPLMVAAPPEISANDPAADVKPLKGEEPPPVGPEQFLENNPAAIPVEISRGRVETVVKIDQTKIGPPGDPNGDPEGNPRIPGSKFFAADRLDNIPRAKSQIPPSYPSALKRDKVDGEVWVEFDVDAKGRVMDARVKSSTDRLFEEPTLQAVRKWRFEPGKKGGLPVPFRMLVPVSFAMRGE